MAMMLVLWGIYPNQKIARKCLHKLVDRGILDMVGVADLRGFHELMFSAVRFPSNQVQHHAEVMYIVNAISPDQVISGEDLEYRADRIIVINGEKRYVERESGKKKSSKQLKERLKEYIGCESPILWIVDTEAERKRYLKVMEECTEHHLVGLYEQVLAAPRGEVWEGRE